MSIWIMADNPKKLDDFRSEKYSKLSTLFYTLEIGIKISC